jgi:hypothetical protein
MAAAKEKEEDDNESELSEAVFDEPQSAQSAEQDLPGMPLDAMTPAQLKKQFGRNALDVLGAMWQHQSKIAHQARFIPKVLVSHLQVQAKRAS